MSILKELSTYIICYSNSPFSQILVLGQRFSTNIFRTRELFAAKIIQAVHVGLVLGTSFLNATNDSSKLQNQFGFFAVSIAFLLLSITETLPIFLQEKRILMRETPRGAYRISSCVISNIVVFLHYLLTTALLFTIPVYWLVGLRREIDGFLYFLLGMDDCSNCKLLCCMF